MAGEELLDWEMVHGSDTESTDSITSEKKSGSSSVIDDGMILSDHFSADNLITDQSLESGDSSRVDYGSESPNRMQNPVDLGYQSGHELGLIDGEVRVSDFEESDEKSIEGEGVADESHIEDVSKCLSESDDLEVADGRLVESQSSVEEPIDDLSKSLSDSGGNELVSGDSRIVNGQEEIVSDNGVVSTEAIVGSGGNTVNRGDESKSRETVWWKMPFVLVKYYAFRIGPVWSLSMAAAVMGFVLLGRRLYHMKKKAQRFHLKVAIDEKKVLRVMSQAARLNEAFTEVRRVPVIRPALLSPGAWPVLSLR